MQFQVFGVVNNRKMDSIATFLLGLIFLAPHIHAMDNLTVAYSWKILDFEFPAESARQEALASGDFIPENNIPSGIEVVGDRLFITVPRWKPGVAATLTYINTTDKTPAPLLKPYPNWAAHNTGGLISPVRIQADHCGRLWVLDTGLVDILGNTTSLSGPRLLIYDLTNDELLRTYDLPKDQHCTLPDKSYFFTIAVEDTQCADTFAYLADQAQSVLVVYSFKSNESWLVKHHYFSMEPEAGEFSVAGDTKIASDGLAGLALSKAKVDGYSELYFHPLVSFSEFSVSTRILRNQTLWNDPGRQVYKEFRELGSRGNKSQSGASFLDKETGVLFYTLLNLNATACWRSSMPNANYTMMAQGRIHMSNETMVFPSDLTVDDRGNLWVLSNRFQAPWSGRGLDYGAVNFRVLRAKVADAIRGTACDSKMMAPVPPLLVKIRGGNGAGGRAEVGVFALVAIVAIFRF